MTTNITLRIPDDLTPLVDQASGHDGLSRHAWIIQALREAVAPSDFEAGLVLGFTELVGGEIDHDADCPECGQPFSDKGVYIGFVAGKYRPLTFGPVCGSCATTQ